MDDGLITNGILHSQTVSDQIYAILRQKIIDGSIGAGEPLVTSRLAEMLNTSRTPLREAIKRLEEAGWVVRKTNGIVAVTKLTLKELKEIYTVRATLEGLAAYEATTLIREDELIMIEKKLLQYTEIRRESEISTIIEMGEEIHHMIQQAANNTLCTALLEQILKKMQRYRAYSTSIHGRYQQTMDEHRKILFFMRERNPEAAEKAMREHIMNAGNMALINMQKNESNE
jgi:DNA-binding GntR family transcriptional regulator